MKYRIAAVAGSFYPATAEQIDQQLSVFLNAPSESTIQAKALIVPHAGYCYSGAVAGYAYSYLKNITYYIHRVILLGPSHRVALQGCALSNCDCFTTPLGSIPIDKGSYTQLLQEELVTIDDQAHLLEHSLEVQLPFLQRALHDFELVPIVVGQCSEQDVSRILAILQVDEPGTLVVVSSDLSHYHSYQEAQLLDDRTIQHILNYEYNLKGEDACGCYAINGLLSYAKKQHWAIKLLKKANSGDTLGSKKEVVGYASFILY
ncbi:AmmeMemoRadiSam system protein B [Psychromonas sp. MB-3u-54]|uniref:AmmeMemoRadiSam system protein B n=1 Tax=Psychromonas sp. MB-3u-54 TaxID=2058319 RepID=UPI000C349FB2|nr:AmmeMemoRadiSam system protein B [Psychromonas sp. MB-3u-54]PKH02499.1 AmmeMemoRadiSam system protein B [Psychromonas sp. MB-3u-54]